MVSRIMKLILVVFLTVVSFLDISQGARILGVVPTPSYSHQVVFHPLWKELSLRGHQVIVLTTDPIRNPSLTNLTEIDLHYTYDKWNPLIERMQEDYFEYARAFLIGLADIMDLQLQHPEVQKLLQSKTDFFDVVLIEHLHIPTMFGFVQKFNCPSIGIVSLEAASDAYRAMGNPVHPVLYPNIDLPYASNLNFMNRIIAVAMDVFSIFYLQTFVPYAQSIAEKHFDVKDLDVQHAMDNVDMLFVNANPILQKTRPLTFNVIEIGGGMQLKPIKPLPPNIQMFLDKATEGFIYFSLGTNAKSKDLPKSVLDTFLKTFAKLPYKILWKFEDDNLKDKPDNVLIEKWLPQQDVLRHPNIKLFIFQCGLQSAEEAIFSKVPILGIPIIADQFYNAKQFVFKGMGLELDHLSMTTESLESSILEVIGNPKFRNRMAELADLLADQPMTGLQKAVWWTEYVIRHKGAKHFRAPDIPLYQYFLLDVIGFCLSVVLLLVFLLFTFSKAMIKLVRLFIKKVKSKVD